MYVEKEEQFSSFKFNLLFFFGEPDPTSSFVLLLLFNAGMSLSSLDKELFPKDLVALLIVSFLDGFKGEEFILGPSLLNKEYIRSTYSSTY